MEQNQITIRIGASAPRVFDIGQVSNYRGPYTEQTVRPAISIAGQGDSRPPKSIALRKLFGDKGDRVPLVKGG